MTELVTQGSLLLVCTANLCRSPMAETVLRAYGAGWALIASAGTRAAPRAHDMDARARAALVQRRYQPAPKWRSRRVIVQDYAQFSRILAMDEDNMNDLRRSCPPEHLHKLGMFLDLVPGMAGQSVPDPYFGSAQGFERVLDLIEAAVREGGTGPKR